jgi:hypothetical protein
VPTNPVEVGDTNVVTLLYDKDAQRLTFDLGGAQWLSRDPVPAEVRDGTAQLVGATVTLVDDWETDLEGEAGVQLVGIQDSLVFVGGPPVCM